MKQFACEFIERNRMLVLSDDGKNVVIGYSRKADSDARARTERAIAASSPGAKISFRELAEPELMLKAAEYGLLSNQAAHKGSTKNADAYGLDIAAIDAGAPAITLLNSLLLEARERGASDIHLERIGSGTTLRLRLDGVLSPIRTFDAETGKTLAVRIKLLANLNTLETRRPQDGRFSIRSGNGEHDIRASTVPCAGGESVVLRFLDAADGEIALDRLGFTGPSLREIGRIHGLTQGLVLVTGPTGSGKTTTLAAVAKSCNPESRKIVSIEDPVEYRIPGVIQIQTNDPLGLDFSAILRRVLRQDPDVILIGEIRDTETASLAVRAALTGHLVISTLHTGSALEAETRLSDMGVPRYILQSVLQAVFAQRLVRRSDPVEGFSGRLPIVECARRDDSGKQVIARSFDEEIGERLEAGLTTQEEIRRVFGERRYGGLR